MGQSLPGQRAGRSVTPRQVLLSTVGARFERGVIDATYAYDGKFTSYEDELRPGTIMAKITGSNLWVPCKRTRTAALHSTTEPPTGSELVVVDDARAFKVGDTVTVGSNTGLTVTAVDYSTNTITVDDDVVWDDNAIVIGSGDLAGSEIARGILNEHIKLLDEDAVLRDKQTGQIIVAGYVDYDLVLGDLTSIRLATNYLSHIQFNDSEGTGQT